MLFPDIRARLPGKIPGLAQAAGLPGSLSGGTVYGEIADRLPNRSKSCALFRKSCVLPGPEQFSPAAGSRHLLWGDCGETFLNQWAFACMSGRTSLAWGT